MRTPTAASSSASIRRTRTSTTTASASASSGCGTTTTRRRITTGTAGAVNEWLNDSAYVNGWSKTNVGGLAERDEVTAGDPYAYYFTNHLGSTNALYDDGKNRDGGIGYTPYGTPMNVDGSGNDTTRRYTGHAWDPLTENYFAPYRYYSPYAHRWLTRDPLGMIDGPNVYVYVHSSPSQHRDHLGLLYYGPHSNPTGEVAGCLGRELNFGDGHPNEHCVNSCAISRCISDGFSEWFMDTFKEHADSLICISTGTRDIVKAHINRAIIGTTLRVVIAQILTSRVKNVVPMRNADQEREKVRILTDLLDRFGILII